MKNFLYIICSLFFGLCLIYLSQIIYEKCYETKQEIILIQSDLFSNIEYVDINALISEIQISSLFKSDDKFDSSFKIALFYSDLSIIILKRSKTEKYLNKYVDNLFKKSLEKWDDLIKKDNSMLFFKNYYLKTYTETLKIVTN